MVRNTESDRKSVRRKQRETGHKNYIQRNRSILMDTKNQ